MKPGVTGFRADINALRALAVTCVVAFHFGLSVLPGGFAGVDIFFVISGYLMTSIIMRGLYEGKFSVWRFYLARARRIVPGLLAVCAVLMLMGWFLIPPSQYVTLGEHTLSALGFFSNFVFWREAGYFDSASSQKWLLHTWSLSVEWQFYLAYPWAVVVLRRCTSSERWFRAAFWFATVLSLALCIYVTGRNPTIAFYLLPTRAWEMLAGGLVFIYGERVTADMRMQRGLLATALILLLPSLCFFRGTIPWPGYAAIMPVLAAALVILARSDAGWLRNRVAQAIGRWSYSIYLWHWPIFVALNQAGKADQTIYLLGGATLSVLIGACSYKFIEEPGRRFSLQPLNVPAMLGLVMSCLAIGACTLALEKNGMPERAWGDASQTARFGAAMSEPTFPESCGGLDAALRPNDCNSNHIGPQTSGRVLFIGDSHAQHYLPLFAGRPNLKRGVDFFTYPGCPPLPGISRLKGGFRCNSFFGQAMQKASAPAVGAVVISSVWVEYFRDDDACPAVGDTCSPRRALTNEEITAAFDRLAGHLASLHALGKEVFIVLPLPRSTFNTPRELERRTFLNQSTKDLLFIPLSDHRKRIARIEAQLRRVANMSGAHLIDPADMLCDKNACSVLGPDGGPVYMDDNHLRPGFVRKYLRLFDALNILPD